MNLFTYLMSKKGYEYLPHEDLFSYLLGKNNSIPKTKTGTELTFNSIIGKLISLILDKESTQITTSIASGDEYDSPSPDHPQEVKVVEGYRNLFDSNIEIGGINSQSGDPNNPLNPRKRTADYISVEEKNYTLSSSSIDIQAYCYCYDISKTYLGYLEVSWTTLPFNFTTLPNTKYIKFVFRKPDNTEIGEISNLQLTEGNQELPYVPHGNNYIAVNVSDGNTTNNYPIPLNNNIIAGIGDYKDELIVDKTGHVYLNKKTNKIVLNGSEESLATQRSTSPYVYRVTINDYLREASLDISLCNYYQATSNGTYNSLVANQCRFRYASGDSNNYFYICDEQQSTLADFKNWLSTHNTEVYYVLATPELIDLQTTVDIELFKGENTITNSEDCNMTIQYF